MVYNMVFGTYYILILCYTKDNNSLIGDKLPKQPTKQE
jgi:hypothetical protein